jgi:ketosteroid isomerase-like protein
LADADRETWRETLPSAVGAGRADGAGRIGRHPAGGSRAKDPRSPGEDINGVEEDVMGATKDVVDRVWAAMESGDLDSLEQLMDPEIEFRMGSEGGHGIAFFRPFLDGYLAAFAKFRHEIIDWVESGDTIALELHVRGTHTGALQTPQGEIEPTRREVLWESADYVKIRDRRIRSGHVYTDNLAFMAQLGLIPATA